MEQKRRPALQQMEVCKLLAANVLRLLALCGNWVNNFHFSYNLKVTEIFQ